MISIIVTGYKEEKTVGKCIKSITGQKIKEKYELIVVAPDKETLKAAKKASRKVIALQDKGKGKFDALNLAFRKAKGRILILLDADTFLKPNSINPIIDAFDKDEKVGIISGRPISANSKDNMLGYWSHLLTFAAHKERLRRRKNKEFIACSGYLLGLRKGIVKKLPSNLLSEDAYMSHFVWSKGYDTEYVPQAKVVVKYPTTFSDWIKQKRRSAGGYPQIRKYFKKNPVMRSFWKELVNGPIYVLTYAKNIKEFIWSLALFPARAYLWLLTAYDRIKKKKFKEIWQRVETTK